LTRCLELCVFIDGVVSLPLQDLLALHFLGDLRLHCPIATFGSLTPRAFANQLRLYLINLPPHPQRRQFGFKFAPEFAPLVMAVITTPARKVCGLLSIEAHRELLRREWIKQNPERRALPFGDRWLMTHSARRQPRHRPAHH